MWMRPGFRRRKKTAEIISGVTSSVILSIWMPVQRGHIRRASAAAVMRLSCRCPYLFDFEDKRQHTGRDFQIIPLHSLANAYPD